jgi:ATP-dependent exoDNAse (exonuclease V) alpha subunit
VKILKERIRAELISQGSLGSSKAFKANVGRDELRLAFDLEPGDEVLFKSRDRGLSIRENGGNVSVKTDSGNLINFRQEDYSDIAHGYATTVHKSQGMTVDRPYMLGTRSMDKHIAYVGMSRHRESLEIYTNDESGFVNAVSRVNRQETALDFAETRGLELVSDVHSGAIDRILIGEEAGCSRESPNTRKTINGSGDLPDIWL